MKKLCTNDLGHDVYQCYNSKKHYVAYPSADYIMNNIFYDICENDPYFYQSCGTVKTTGISLSALCGFYICEPKSSEYRLNNAAFLTSAHTVCQKEGVCSSADACDVPLSCENVNHTTVQCEQEIKSTVTLPTGLKVPRISLCNGACDVHFRCEDEAFCEGYLYGMYCNNPAGQLNYVRPREQCNGRSSKYLCANREDELGCPNVEEANEIDLCDKIQHHGMALGKNVSLIFN